MTVETANYIGQLDVNLPSDSDIKNEGDNHIRLIKQTWKSSFPNVTAPVTITVTEFDMAFGLARPLQSQINLKAPVNSPAFTGTPTVPYPESGAPGNQVVPVKYVKDAALVPANLPGQDGKIDWILTTDGTNATWSNTINTDTVKPSGGTDFITTLGAENLRNKTFPGAPIVDSVDATKTLTFDMSSISTGAIRTVYLDDHDMNVAEHRERWLYDVVAANQSVITIPFTGTEYTGFLVECLDFNSGATTVPEAQIRYILDGVVRTGHYIKYPADPASIPFNYINIRYPYFPITPGIIGHFTFEADVANISSYQSARSFYYAHTQAGGYLSQDGLVVTSYNPDPPGKMTGIQITASSGSLSGTFSVYGVK